MKVDEPLSSCDCCVPRRRFLGGLAALGASTVLPATDAFSQGAASKAPFRRVDVHHHFGPPFWVKAARDARVGGGAPWTVEGTLADMDKGGVAKSVLSLIQPGTWFTDDQQARKLAREVNEYAAKLRSDHPTRFGIFTTLPMPDVEGSLKEIEYGMDVMKADGLGMFTSYGPKYLGDASFTPVLEEINRRKLVVYVHPASPECCSKLQAEVNPSTIEYATDTTRTIASLLFSGAANRFPDIRWIWSHSGGTMPFLFERFLRQEDAMKGKAKEVLPNGSLYHMKRFYYETAQGNSPMQLAALLKMIPVSQVLFGSDYPYRPATECVDGLARQKFRPAELRAIEHDNALRMMPGLKV
jgi:predicted TIM-barrel fold metal-dependent hydrolase